MERRILCFYSYDSLGNPWVGGGGAVRDFEILRRFARHTRVMLIVGRYPGFRPCVRDGVEIRGLGLGRGNNWLCRISYAFAANAHVLFQRADFLVNSVSIYAPILTGLFRRRFYHVVHHYVGRDAFKRDGLFGVFPWMSEKLLLRFGRRYLVLNDALLKRIRNANPDANVRLTKNGLDPSLLHMHPRPAWPRFILFLGRFDLYMKGLDLLIPAYAQSLADRGIGLVLAGRASPEDLARVRALVPTPLANSVRLETDVTEERKRELLSSCLFFCSPSRFEGFGMAALEANAAGKAVLATDVEGFRNSLSLGETALAVPPGNLPALREAMARLIEDEELREHLGRRGGERARDFAWDAIAEEEWTWITETGHAISEN